MPKIFICEDSLFLYVIYFLDGLHLRQGIVRKPHGIQSLPVPISKMYKSVKWWTDYPGDCRVLIKADKQELGSYFKDQMQQVWDVSTLVHILGRFLIVFHERDNFPVITSKKCRNNSISIFIKPQRGTSLLIQY